jgi:phosphoribosylaminoimidazolecarboxamide formyltransferase / IMP cyclohydrolase
MSTRMYRTINRDSFPPAMEITFRDENGSQTLLYDRVSWTVEGEDRGLRYGENPDQQAALYRLVNGNLTLGEVSCISPGRYLASDIEILHSGKHPGKINITDVDSALNFLRYLTERPATVIVKHNNPCGVALGETLEHSYSRAYFADRVAAFGGAVAVNRPVDLPTAEAIADSYSEVVAAPSYEEGTVELLSRRKNLRVLRIENIDRLAQFQADRVIDFSSLMDGGLIVQWSQVPDLSETTFSAPARATRKGVEATIQRVPTDAEQRDMRFGWLVEFGVTSNSVLYVKDEVTVGIGTGEQDRVGVAEIARDKAYRKYADRLAFEETGTGLYELSAEERDRFIARAESDRGGIPGGTMVSDAFFPFTDGVEIGIREGVTAIVQPGGALRDTEIIETCNRADVTMVFTGQRSFRH